MITVTEQESEVAATVLPSDRGITSAELAAHNGRDGTYWLSIHGTVYDMTDFYRAGAHPGGEILRTAAGRDGTCLYESYHPFVSQSKVAAMLRARCRKVGVFLDQDPLGNDGFWKTVSARAREALKKAGRTHHSSAVATTEAVITVMVYYALMVYINITASFLGAVALGFVTGRMGFLMHAGVHCGFSDNSWVNYVVGLTMDMAGGNHTVWAYEHNVAHHGSTQEAFKDNDATIGKPHVRLHPEVEHRWYQRYQQFYLFVAMTFGFFRWFVADVISIGEGRVGSISFYAQPAELASCFFFKLCKLVLFFLIPAYLHGLSTAAGLIFVHYAIGAHYLENIFIVNHIQDDTYPDPKRHWAEKQLEGTWNWRSGSTIANWISGGLNHQIEHHLFPAMAPGAYPVIQPVVKKTCEEYGIAYNSFDSFSEAWLAMWRNVRDLGAGSHMDMVKKVA
mmetsp:Transcript_3739/g.9392  ORF Transcript_3739/g.9392 Transcript_3739/m.9392 type:complete len:450 (-) Transcript_3739:263-1612(-)